MRFSLFGYSALGVVLIAASAQAGGFSRGTADTDILYEDGNFNFRAGATVVVPSHEFTSAPVGSPDPAALVGTDYLDTYVIPSAAVKFMITENLSCAGTFTQPFGASTSYAAPFGVSGKLSEDLTLNEFGATCAAFFEAGPGRLAILGGGFYETLDYDLEALPPGLGGAPLSIGLGGKDYGWRAGVAYEIPDIALRAQILYRSGTSYGATGSATSPAFPLLGAPGSTLPATGTGELPQSVELKVQSGIAPGWLAFGSVKWMDWSVNETLQVNVPGTPVSAPNDYYWRDGWTVTGGIGHAFNERVSGLVSLQWDRGVATGYDLRSDKWMLAGAASFKDDLGGELRLGAGAVYLASADIDQPDARFFGASADSGWAGIFSASYSVKW
ncbi:outer membrane protein transport protein [Chelativorans salis]|uniref:Outer membrane protein transport protein n=1 Tax=Chelativorans salis TaxID=2978478 RepID=A0ABT2LQ44_9HYPH|nr:outer membrane protein transport protein [Chelativorans sp. EGI FJ00035]MCT7375319.1 outer membrane protein transport protein [Chelativorans sp. EGI FJ00035]